MSEVVTGTNARPGDLVDVCACTHIADWHYQVQAESGVPVFALKNGTRARCPSPRCGCEHVYRDGTRSLARIPTPHVLCRAQRC